MTKRMHFTRVIWGCLVALVSVTGMMTGQNLVLAAGPVQQAYFEPDYEASGFVAPAGMPNPDAYFQAVEQAGFFGNGPIGSRLTGGMPPAGYGCESPYGGCDGNCGPYGCGPGANGLGACGPEGCGCGPGGCGSRLLGGGGCGLHRLCLFCRGDGCGICQSVGRGYVLGALRGLLPYGDAGLSAQRWFDLSFDVMFLELGGGSGSQVLTTRGVDGTPVLLANSGDDNSMRAGGRISGAFIVGPGGNIEVTYLGGNQWKDSASVSGDGDLFSFLSDFGQNPGGPTNPGFDDSDRSNLQSASTTASLHSGEVNYRRRTVGPYGRFQGSWLGGIRYLRFDSGFEYAASGDTGFFNFGNGMQNEMVGAQIGGDLWWNVIPGVNLGFGAKGGPMGNRINRYSSVSASSLASSGADTLADHISRTAWMSELEATVLYRLSHSWTLKGQCYVLHVDEIGHGFDTSLADAVALSNLSGNPGPLAVSSIETRSLTVSGFSLGLEYVW